MVNSICKSIRSYFQEHPNVRDTAIVAGGCALGAYCRPLFGAIPDMLLILGAYLVSMKYSPPKPNPVPPAAPPKPVVKPPIHIIWANSSCFASVTMWALFLNEPIFMREIPASIKRRLKGREIFNGPLEKNLSSEKRAALVKIAELLRQDTPVFRDLRIALQTLETEGFPKGMNENKANALLSLLELQGLIEYCQNNDPVHGDAINLLREMVRRLNPSFSDGHGKGYADPNELFTPLTELIFENSESMRSFHTTKQCRGLGRYALSAVPEIDEIRNDRTGLIHNNSNGQIRNPATGEIKTIEHNWGHFSLPVIPGRRVESILEDQLRPTEKLVVKYYSTASTIDPKSHLLKKSDFEIEETSQFASAPELLVLTMKRYPEIKKSNPMYDPWAPVVADEEIVLDAKHCLNGQKGTYKLFGVIRGHHDKKKAHYTAEVKRSDGICYHCDDLNRKADPPSNLINEASVGYVLVYRKVPSSNN